MENIHQYKNAASTSSLIICKDDGLYLVKRKHEPFKGMWALPGGFLDCDKESLEHAAVRELLEETSLEALEEDLELVKVNSNPKRDPRGHVIDHVFFVKKYKGEPRAADDASEIKLFPFDNLPELAFDHKMSINRFLLFKPLWDFANLNLKIKRQI